LLDAVILEFIYPQ